MSITYEEALQTLQSMFSGYTTQQLDALLRHHGGHMEHTVETMLAYADRCTPEELIEKLKDLPKEGVSASSHGAAGGGGAPNSNSGGGGQQQQQQQHSVDADEELARQLAAEDERASRSAAASRVLSGRSSQTTGRSTYGQTGRSGGSAGIGGSGGGGGGVAGLGRAIGNIFSGGASPPPGQQRPTLPKNSWTAPSSRVIHQVQSSRQVVPPANDNPSGRVNKKGRGTPTILPSDFLRIPGRKYPSSSSSSVNGTANANSIGGAAASAGGNDNNTLMTDEQLARMLQDELFQEELRNNPEFSHLAGRGHLGMGRNGSSSMTGRSTYSGARGGASTGTGRGSGSGVGGGGGMGGWNERTDIFDRLSDMGDMAKRRFQEFAANWGDPNRQQHPHPSHSNPSRNSRSSNEQRGLLSNDLNMEEEEEEMNFIGGGGGGGEFVELGDFGSGGGGAGSKKKD